jgi:hypothetical protein
MTSKLRMHENVLAIVFIAEASLLAGTQNESKSGVLRGVYAA